LANPPGNAGFLFSRRPVPVWLTESVGQLNDLSGLPPCSPERLGSLGDFAGVSGRDPGHDVRGLVSFSWADAGTHGYAACGSGTGRADLLLVTSAAPVALPRPARAVCNKRTTFVCPVGRIAKHPIVARHSRRIDEASAACSRNPEDHSARVGDSAELAFPRTGNEALGLGGRNAGYLNARRERRKQ
jgi:hypothetical protein